jgi:hypothetical protein
MGTVPPSADDCRGEAEVENVRIVEMRAIAEASGFTLIGELVEAELERLKREDGPPA